MKLLSKYTAAFGVLSLFLTLHTGCTKEQIAPPNQSVAFVKYYGHVGNQKGYDLKRTSDGGYIMIGSTNSFSSQSESDIMVVKTDSLGNEEWSTALGKSAAFSNTNGTHALAGKYIRYDEEGIRVIPLPDGSGYVVAANRTYNGYDSESSTDKSVPNFKTKVVLYLLDAAGVATSINGVELKTNTDETEKVSDMKIDTTAGLLRYVLTGHTTDVNPGKPLDQNLNSYDEIDIFTVLLDETFNILWLNHAYGFSGNDYGTSVHVLPDFYLVTGTTQKQEFPLPFYDRLIAVRITKNNGIGVNPQFYGDETYDMYGGCSAYDPTNNRITIAGMVDEGVTRTDVGGLIIVQVEESSLNPITTGTGHAFGFRYYRPTPPTTIPPANRNRYYPKSIALLPEDEGFIISTTHAKSSTENNVAIFKIDENFALEGNLPFYFGYEDAVGSPNPTENAGAIIPVTESIAGTSQSTLRGYAFTGTFDIGTNDMIGLIKINTDGTFNP